MNIRTQLFKFLVFQYTCRHARGLTFYYIFGKIIQSFNPSLIFILKQLIFLQIIDDLLRFFFIFVIYPSVHDD